MMQEAISRLQGISPQDFLSTIAVLIFLTCMGVLPNNNDLVLVAATLIAKLKMIALFPVLITIGLTWVAGETTMYLLGRWFGRRIIQWGFIQKRISAETWVKLESLINEKPLPLFLLLRITPIFRAYLMVGLGSLGMRPQVFFRLHPWILLTYVFVLGTLFYNVGDVIQDHFSAHQGWIATFVILIWMSALWMVGRRFTKRLMNPA
jgi:membrane protein DedA with SNARE-associated domain